MLFYFFPTWKSDWKANNQMRQKIIFLIHHNSFFFLYVPRENLKYCKYLNARCFIWSTVNNTRHALYCFHFFIFDTSRQCIYSDWDREYFFRDDIFPSFEWRSSCGDQRACRQAFSFDCLFVCPLKWKSTDKK